jgi:hypothetical protein
MNLTIAEVIAAMPRKTELAFMPTSTRGDHNRCMRVNKKSIFMHGVSLDMVKACTLPGCTIKRIRCPLDDSSIILFELLAQGLLPSVTKLHLMSSIHPFQMVKTSYHQLIVSSSSSVTCLSGHFWLYGACDDISLLNPHGRIHTIDMLFPVYMAQNEPIANSILRHCLKVRRVRAYVVLLLFRMHPHIVRQVAPFLV